jgi:hypothetical protein
LPIIIGFRFPIKPTSKRKRAAFFKDPLMPPDLSIEPEKQSEDKVIPPKICDDFHKAACTLPAVPPPYFGNKEMAVCAL